MWPAEASTQRADDVEVHFALGTLLASYKQYRIGARELELGQALQPERLEILFNEQAAEEDADTDVRERAEGEDAPRGVDERADLRVALLDLPDDRADRLVDERDPDFVRRGHAERMP